MTSARAPEQLEPIRWGIVGTGAIADVFATSIAHAGVGTTALTCSRNQETADTFAQRHGGAGVTSVDALLDPDRIDAIYIATPHAMHRDVAERALHAGVPVLCEKPMTCCEADTSALVGASRATGVPLVEAWMYRWHPQIELLVDLVRSDAVGRIEHVEATFGFRAAVDASHRLRNPALGGGAILDIGGYTMSSAMLVAQATHPDASIETIDATGALDHTGVDADARCSVAFSNGLTASLHATISEDIGTSLRCIGTRGSIELPCPYLPERTRTGLRGEVRLTLAQVTRSQHPSSDMDCFSLEAVQMARLLRTPGEIEPPFPAVDHRSSIMLSKALDRWRASVHAFCGQEHST